MFEFHLDLLADNPNINIDDLLGQNVTVSYKLPIGGKRYFNGFVSEFSFVGERGEYAHYQATLRPWYWLMTRTPDSRIFQFMKVPDIIQAVFARNGGFRLLAAQLGYFAEKRLHHRFQLAPHQRAYRRGSTQHWAQYAVADTGHQSRAA